MQNQKLERETGRRVFVSSSVSRPPFPRSFTGGREETRRKTRHARTAQLIETRLSVDRRKRKDKEDADRSVSTPEDKKTRREETVIGFFLR